MYIYIYKYCIYIFKYFIYIHIFYVDMDLCKPWKSWGSTLISSPKKFPFKFRRGTSRGGSCSRINLRPSRPPRPMRWKVPMAETFRFEKWSNWWAMHIHVSLHEAIFEKKHLNDLVRWCSMGCMAKTNYRGLHQRIDLENMEIYIFQPPRWSQRWFHCPWIFWSTSNYSWMIHLCSKPEITSTNSSISCNRKRGRSQKGSWFHILLGSNRTRNV